jgi:RecB family exonuclease
MDGSLYNEAMSDYYRGKRSKNMYDPDEGQPFKLSRSRIDLFMECPRCFYIDRRMGVDRPPGYPFALNSAVDNLLKNEFDALREKESTHPLIKHFGIDARPVAHDMLDEWRENFKGAQFHHQPTNFIITGAIDDLWINSNGEYIVVDYKATAKSEPVKKLGNGDHHNRYRRQLEIYQWLLRRNGLIVSDTGYWVYCTGQRDKEKFDARIDFDINIIPHKGNDEWVEPMIYQIKHTLNSDQIPEPSDECDYCLYWYEREKIEQTESEAGQQ